MADVDQTLASITTGADKKNDALMMMSSDCNWGQFLTPAPYAIALLGDLLLISTDTDFSLEEKAPAGGYKLLRYPNSFRACLVQVTNEGWTAFNTAHTNMDQIRMQCSNVDYHVRNAVRFLLQGSPREVEKMIPLSLDKIRQIADECLVLVKEVEGGFVGIMHLIAELLEASTNTKGVYEEKQKETEIAIKVANTSKERLDKDIKESEQRLKNLSAEVEDAQSDFKHAIDTIPSGGEILGLMAGEALVNGLNTAITLGMAELLKQSSSTGASETSTVPGATSTVPGANGTVVNVNSTGASDNIDVELSKQKVYKEVPTIYRFIGLLYEIATSKVDTNTKSPDWQRMSNEGSFILQSLQAAKADVDTETNSGDLHTRVSSVCNDAISVCTELHNISKNLAIDDKKAEITDLVQKAASLKLKAQTLNAEAKRGLSANPLDSKSPFLSEVPAKSNISSVAQAATENARYKTQIAKETLKDAKSRQEKATEDLKKTNDKLSQVLTDMAKLNIEEVDFDTIRETLVKGIKALAELREQWGKLVRFFLMLSNIIKVCLNTSLKEYVDQVKTGRALKMDDYSMPLSNIFKDVIFEQASKSSQLAYVVHTVSEAYVQISQDYLMDKITALSHLIALDPKKDKQTITLERNKLFSGCQQAQNAIRKIVMKEKQKFRETVDARIAKITEIEAKLPTIDQEKEKEIKESVSKGFAQGKSEETSIDRKLDDLV